MDLKTKLQKVKEAARVAREASEAVEVASYKCGVLETETRLAEKLAGVYKDYSAETWAKALNQARIPTNSKLRRPRMYSFLRTYEKSQQRYLLPLLILSPFLGKFP